MPIVNFPSTQQFRSGVFTNEINTSGHFQGTYELATLRIKLKNNSIIELGAVFTSMEVYEDAFKYSIEGKIRIKDYVGGQEKFIITGGEELAIVLLKPNGSNEILVSRKDLIVTKISEIIFTQANFREYDLFFTSKTSINSMKNKVFRSFGNDRNLQSVVSKLFRETKNSTSKISILGDDVRLDNPYLCEGLRPLDAINFLAKRACSNKDYYLFYERFSSNPTENFTHVFAGFNYLKNFWQNVNSIPKIVYEPNTNQINYIDEIENEELIHAYYLRVEPNYDNLALIKSGFYNSRVRKLNLISRTYNDTKINYSQEFNKTVKDTYANKFINDDNIFNQYDDTTIERLIVSPSNDVIQNNDQWIKYDTLGSIINSGLRVVVQISGSSNKLCVGNMVELSVPSDVSKTLYLNDSDRHEDQMYSGRYMITAVKHEIDPKSYKKTLELSRGSLKFNMDTIINKYLVNDSDII